METTTAIGAMSMLEGEIQAAFEQINEDKTRVAYVLSLLHLEPIEQRLFNRYRTWTGDGRLKFAPMAVIKSMLLKKLKGIRSYQKLITYLSSKPEESTLLGFDKFLPSIQTFSMIKCERIDSEIQQLMAFVVERIRQFAKQTGRRMDMDFLRPRNRRGKSQFAGQRHTTMAGGKVARYVKKLILPQFMHPSDDNYKCRNDHVANALSHMTQSQICANQDRDLVRNSDHFPGGTARDRTLLDRLVKRHPAEMRAQSITFFDAVFRLAKSRGLVPSHPVVLALDYTEIPCCGDSNKPMVVEGKPDGRTHHKHRQASIRMSEKWGDLFLLALPVDVLTGKRETIRELIEFSRQRVRIKHIVVDKAFFSSEYISLFHEMGIRYLIPDVESKKIRRLIKQGVETTRITIHNKGRTYKARIHLAFKKGKGGNLVCLATNLPPIMLYGSDLPCPCGKTSNVETGFQAVKYEFMPRIMEYEIATFLSMASQLLYNVWVIVNAWLNRDLYGRQEGLRLIPPKLFMVEFYQAYVGFKPPSHDI